MDYKKAIRDAQQKLTRQREAIAGSEQTLHALEQLQAALEAQQPATGGKAK